MNSFFKYKIEDFSKDVMNHNPAAQSGWIIQAKDVLNDSMQNPYFLALNGMSPAQAYAASDKMSEGIAVVVKEPGAARTEKVYVRPKIGNSAMFGDATGKTGQIPAYGRADMIFSGGNNETPTVVCSETLQPVVDNTTASGRDIAANTPLSGNIDESLRPMAPEIPKNDFQKAVERGFNPSTSPPTGKSLDDIIKDGWKGRTPTSSTSTDSSQQVSQGSLIPIAKGPNQRVAQGSLIPITKKNPEFRDLVGTAFNIYHNNARTGTTYDPVNVIADYNMAGGCFG